MRPKSIIAFERLYLLAIFIELVRIGMQWPLLVKSSGVDLWGRVLAVGLSLLFLLLASRRRHWWAALVLAGFFVFGLPMAGYVFKPGTAASTAATIILQLALQAAAIVMMITAASREWFKAAPAD